MTIHIGKGNVPVKEVKNFRKKEIIFTTENIQEFKMQFN